MTASGDEPACPDRAQAITSLTLAAGPAAARRARRLVRLALTRWGFGPLTGDAELVVSELATNAVQATGASPADQARDEKRAAAVIGVRVLLYQASIIIEIWDDNPGLPVSDDAACDAEGGRGLMIVTALCSRWDYAHTAEGAKVVWAELAIPATLLTPASLPRRERGTLIPATTQAGLTHDPALLRRVHRALKDL